MRLSASAPKGVLLLAALLLLSSCSSKHYFVNPPLKVEEQGPRYGIPDLPPKAENSDSLHIIVTFSGGGYRAAALSYAVLEELHRTRIEWEGTQRTLLDEVDIISAVSGGSLTAADFLVNRQDFFPGFERRVLGYDLQAATLRRFFSPGNLLAQTSKRYGRGDVLQELLNDKFFGGATYGDLPKHRPIVILNATDIHTGERFGFTQEAFDYLCSDLSRFPVARAVAASMAVPVLASPITVWNHSANCPAGLAGRSPLLRGGELLDEARYLHLADGGLADNTGVRMPLETIAAAGGLLQSTRMGGYKGVRRGVFIIVNALPAAGDIEDDSPDTPGLFRQFRSVYAVPIKRTSADGIGLLGAAVERWAQQVQAASPQQLDGLLDKDLRFHIIEVSLHDVSALPEFRQLRNLPTELKMREEDLLQLKRFVRAKLAIDPAWQSLLQDLRASPSRP
jgi:NTE family protein